MGQEPAGFVGPSGDSYSLQDGIWAARGSWMFDFLKICSTGAEKREQCGLDKVEVSKRRSLS